MRYHYDELILCDLFEKLHYLNGGFAVECACRFVCEEDIGVVDECTGNSDTLHLSAGK